MKSSFLAIALAALFVTAGFAQTEQASVSDATTPEAVVTEVTPVQQTESTPVAAIPVTSVPMTSYPMASYPTASYPMASYPTMPMSGCGCGNAVPTSMPMSSYVMPVTYQEPIVQQTQPTVAQSVQTTAPITQPITQQFTQTLQQPLQQQSFIQQGYTQTRPTYYGAGYRRQNCNCGQPLLATPISTPIVTSTAPIQQSITNVSTPISTPTPIGTTTQPIIGTTIGTTTQPIETQQFAQPVVSQPVTTGQTFGTTTYSGGNYWQPQTVYSNNCSSCNNNSNNGRFFNGRILRRR